MGNTIKKSVHEKINKNLKKVREIDIYQKIIKNNQKHEKKRKEISIGTFQKTKKELKKHVNKIAI